MVRLTVILALLFIDCIQTAPAPLKLALLNNSSFGFGLAALDAKTGGVVQDNQSVDVDVPGGILDPHAEIALVQDVNAGAALAFLDSLSFGVVKDNVG